MEGALSSLVVGERIVSWCSDGLLLAEYGLFEISEVMVSGTTTRGVREEGYLTTAERARERLHAAGITADFVKETFQALRPRLMRALARSPSVLLAVDRLGPYEAFEGGLFHASTRKYQGTWLDIDALVSACPLRAAAELLQAVHLSQVLDEVAGDVPVRLLTANATGELRPGERTWHAVAFEAAPRLPNVLSAMRVPRRKRAIDDGGEVREGLLRGLRARSTAARVAEPRIRSLATLVARTGKTPPPAPLTEATGPGALRPTPSPAPIHLPPSESPISHVDPLPLFDDLRGQTQLLRGEDHLRAVAEYLSSMASRAPAQPDLGVLASRAWLAAGEPGHARHLARRVAEDASVPDAVRLLALEIIEATETQESLPPPPVEGEPIVPMPILLAVPHEQFAPSGASLPPLERAPFKKAPSVTFEAPERTAVQASTTPGPTLAPVTATRVVIVDSPAADAAGGETGPAHQAELIVRPRAPALQFQSEIVESLGLPDGLFETMLAPGAKPSTPTEARIAMTRLSRNLGRDYRLWYGTTLMTSVVAIEAMQRHLRRRFDGKAVAKDDPDQVERELMRHGALLSEILARALGGVWVDVPVDKPGHWAMQLYPDIRLWPIGRVYRFFQQGHRETDLVAFYLDLENQVRRTA